MLNEMEVRAASTSFWRRLGKVKLGLKIKSSRIDCKLQHQHNDACYMSFPKDVEYFVLDKKWHQALGTPEPKELHIVLAFPTLEQSFDSGRAVWRANGTKFCSSTDGVTATRMVEGPKRPDVKTGEMIQTYTKEQIPCLGEACPFAKKCPKKAQLEFMLPASGEIGTFFMKTGSMIGATQMLATLRTLERMVAGRPNGMQGLRLILRRELMVLTPDIKGDGNPQRIEKWIPKLEIDLKNMMRPDQDLLGPMMGKAIALPAPSATEAVLEALPDMDEEDDQP